MSSMQNDKPNSIIKNTLFLYLRMLFIMIVSLFTSRVVLNALGVNDYGIYNVVGGFISMFNVFCAGLSTTTQRFITYDLGKGDAKELTRTFSSCVIIYIFISIIIIIIAEIGGMWFLENKMTIPADRFHAAKYVYQISLLTLVINLISIPYNALIISHEKMKAFAYISIFEASAKLLVAYCILISPFDKLIVYAILLFLIQLIIRCIYTYYCKKNFKEANITYKIDKEKIKQLYSFAGWAMFGGLASMGFTQGLNVLLNIFFSPAINAARGIAVQVQNAVNSFAINFQTAVNPRIIKSFASKDLEYMFKLVFSSSKFSFLLLYGISLPILLETKTILNLWLQNPPEYTDIFLKLIIITTIIDAMSNPFMRVADATGKIKYYQITVGTILLLIVPISYIVLKLGGKPYSVFIVHLIICIIAFLVRLFIVKSLVVFSIRKYFTDVILKLLTTSILTLIIPLIIYFKLPQSNLRLFYVILSSYFIFIIISYIVSLTNEERRIILNKIRRK
ncbi:MATE family efflux transporter [Phocaeicola coprophilus]|uniref:MATE family efflux transporter n=1 Tax=Phocaeicola coprophilus TaxID=387090 RepID=UPI002FD8EE14